MNIIAFLVITIASCSCSKVPKLLEVAIVGGGISGIRIADLLTPTIPHDEIAVFEGLEELGGRIVTRYVDGIPIESVQFHTKRYSS